MTTFDKIVKLIEQYHTENTNSEEAILFLGVKDVGNDICKALYLAPGSKEKAMLILDSLGEKKQEGATDAIINFASWICAENNNYFERFLKTVEETRLVINSEGIN